MNNVIDRVSDEKIQELKRIIIDYPCAFELYKRALICLIDSSENLSKSVCIITHDSHVNMNIAATHSGIYVSQHNPNGIEVHLIAKSFTGRFECETANYGRECRLYWSANNQPLFYPYKTVPFVENA